MTEDTYQTLHLFSSDYRPLYIQDCLDLLAKPEGSLQRFRYQKKWVSVGPLVGGLEESGSKLSAWEELGEKATPVVVYFASVAKRSAGQDTVYVPLRKGNVVRAGVEDGDYFFVEFTLGEYIDPVRFCAASAQDVEAYAQGNRRPLLSGLTSWVRTLLQGRHPAGTYDGQQQIDGYSAVVGASPEPASGASATPLQRSPSPTLQRRSVNCFLGIAPANSTSTPS
jgi:hypothetical protein